MTASHRSDPGKPLCIRARRGRSKIEHHCWPDELKEHSRLLRKQGYEITKIMTGDE